MYKRVEPDWSNLYYSPLRRVQVIPNMDTEPSINFPHPERNLQAFNHPLVTSTTLNDALRDLVLDELLLEELLGVILWIGEADD